MKTITLDRFYEHRLYMGDAPTTARKLAEKECPRLMTLVLHYLRKRDEIQQNKQRDDTL